MTPNRIFVVNNHNDQTTNIVNDIMSIEVNRTVIKMGLDFDFDVDIGLWVILY